MARFPLGGLASSLRCFRDRTVFQVCRLTNSMPMVCPDFDPGLGSPVAGGKFSVPRLSGHSYPRCGSRNLHCPRCREGQAPAQTSQDQQGGPFRVMITIEHSTLFPSHASSPVFDVLSTVVEDGAGNHHTRLNTTLIPFFRDTSLDFTRLLEFRFAPRQSRNPSA